MLRKIINKVVMNNNHLSYNPLPQVDDSTRRGEDGVALHFVKVLTAIPSPGRRGLG